MIPGSCRRRLGGAQVNKLYIIKEVINLGNEIPSSWGTLKNTVDYTSEIVYLKSEEATYSLAEGISKEHRLPSISCLFFTHVRTMIKTSGDKSQTLEIGQFCHVLDFFVARIYAQGTECVH